MPAAQQPPSTPRVKNVDEAPLHQGFEAFDAFRHVSVLHPSNCRREGTGLRNGTVSFARRVRDHERPWQEWSVPLDSQTADYAQEFVKEDAEDLYVSQAAFAGWRCLARLQAIGACYVDLDYHSRATHRQKPAEWVAGEVLRTLDDAAIPAPSYVLATGRGLCCVWLTELLPRAAQSRWKLVQRHLADALTPFGSDKMALDAARVFRVAGSINSRADPLHATVRMVWSNGDPATPFRHSFDDLANEVLPFTRAELHSLAAARVARKAAGKNKNTSPRRLTAETWAEAFLTDLQRLRAHRYPEGAIRPGERDRWLFCAASAMSWIAPPQIMERELAALAREAGGWSERETRSRMSSAIARARMAAEGTRMEWNGKEVDPRYRFRAQTVIDWLEIDATEMREAGLRLLVDSDRRQELNTGRTRESRHQRGAKPRAQVQAERLELGRRALWLAEKDGMTLREIAVELGVSPSHVSKSIAAARKEQKHK